MFDLSFESMGTHWQISVDSNVVPQIVIEEIHKKTNLFDQQYSRFISSSEANSFRTAKAGKYKVSPMLADMLLAGQQLRTLTDGAFDISIATLFEKIGYDPGYHFQNAPETVSWTPPEWSVEKNMLTIDGPVVFDVGGIGKGYWIDRLSDLLLQYDLPNHLVEGGGDMFATQKKDGSSWRVAIEYPGKPDLAIGLVELKNQALAVSDVFKRKWKNWHHHINAKTNKPVRSIWGGAAEAPSAFLADQMTSCLSFGLPEKYSVYAKDLHAEYLVMNANHTIHVSKGWSGEVF